MGNSTYIVIEDHDSSRLINMVMYFREGKHA